MLKYEKESKIIKTIPSTETGYRVTCNESSKNGNVFLITHYPERDRFTLWKNFDTGFQKIATSDSPLDFDDLIPWGE